MRPKQKEYLIMQPLALVPRYNDISQSHRANFRLAISATKHWARKILAEENSVIKPPEVTPLITRIECDFYLMDGNPNSIKATVSWHTPTNNVGKTHLLITKNGEIVTCTTPE